MNWHNVLEVGRRGDVNERLFMEGRLEKLLMGGEYDSRSCGKKFRGDSHWPEYG